MNYLDVANSLPFWFIVAPAIAVVIAQSVLFFRKAYGTGLEMGIPKEKLMAGVKASAIASIGPAIAVLTSMMALFVIMGGPMAWFRSGVIGSVWFEMMAFNSGVEATVGAVENGITLQAFTNGVWVAILGCIPWILVTIFFTDKMSVLQNKVAAGDSKVLAIISAAAVTGGMGTMATGHVIALNNNSIAAIAGAVIMAIICAFNHKRKLGWLQVWSLTIAIFGGMIAAIIL